jgi:hypothetical protein
MDTFLIILGAFLVLLGIAGSVLPVLPGLPVSWVGLLLLKFTDVAGPELSWSVVIWTGVAMLVVSLLDYLLPVMGTKKFGGSKLVVTGASIGMLIGFFGGVWGIVIGPFIGALTGALIEGNTFARSAHQAFGTFVGFFTGIVMKLICGGIIAWYFVAALI